MIGLLAIGSGLIGAVGSRVVPMEECRVANQNTAEAERLNREADAARGTPNESKLREQALEKMKSAHIWAVSCSERSANNTIALILGLSIAAVGFVAAIAGILLFLRGRRYLV